MTKTRQTLITRQVKMCEKSLLRLEYMRGVFETEMRYAPTQAIKTKLKEMRKSRALMLKGIAHYKKELSGNQGMQ